MPGQAALPLVDQVRDAVRAARELYHGTSRAEPLRGLAERLDEPLRVAVAGAERTEVEVIVEMLGGVLGGVLDPFVAGDAPDRVAAPDGSPDALGEAFVLLVRDGAPGDAALVAGLLGGPAPHPAHAVGALVLDEPLDELLDEADRAAARCAARPEVRGLCHVVAPVVPALARGALALDEAGYEAVLAWAERGGDQAGDRAGDQAGDQAGRRIEAPGGGPAIGATDGPAAEAAAVEAGAVAVAAASPAGRALPDRRGGGMPSPGPVAEAPAGELIDRLGPAGARLALAAVRSGQAPTRAALAAALLQRSGLPRLQELVATRLARRAEVLKARSVLLALETLVRTDPPPDGGASLRYRLDRIRSGAHELTESDAVDAMRTGELYLPDPERREAERLLGAEGYDPRTRLGLAPDAGLQDVAAAAGERLGHWQRRAAHPMSGNDARTVAGVLVQTCERLLARSAEI